MTLILPMLSAKPIGVEWTTIEGGFGVAAATDKRGMAYVGLYLIDHMGNDNGSLIPVPRGRLMMPVAIGSDDGAGIDIFFDAHITLRGLELTVTPPEHIKQRGVPRFLSSGWGSKPPERDLYQRLFANNNDCAGYYLSKTA